jgi:hypothetical protein
VAALGAFFWGLSLANARYNVFILNKAVETMSDVIALIFDFDDTLAPDSTSGFLETMGVDTQQFWSGQVDPLLAQDWDPVPAY